MRRRSQHGLSTFLVIGLLGFVALTLLAIGQYFTVQAQRTQRYTAEAQVRQLLLAGERIARESLNAGRDAEGAPPLPAALGEALLTVQRDDDGAYRITATLGRHLGRQRVTYRRTEAGWVLSDAVLEALP